MSHLVHTDFSKVEQRVAASLFDKKMSSREIAEVTGKRHADVMRDIRVLISNGAIDQCNFASISLPDTYGRHQPTFLLDFKATLVLTTGYDDVRRAAVIDRWMALEEGKVAPMAPQLPDFTDPVVAARAWADEHEQKQKAISYIEEKQHKVDYVEEVMEQSDGLMTLGNYGRVLRDSRGLETGPVKIFKELRECKVIMPNKPIPYSYFIDRGWFTVSEKVSYNRVDLVTYVTPKGKLKINEIIRGR